MFTPDWWELHTNEGVYCFKLTCLSRDMQKNVANNTISMYLFVKVKVKCFICKRNLAYQWLLSLITPSDEGVYNFILAYIVNLSWPILWIWYEDEYK